MDGKVNNNAILNVLREIVAQKKELPMFKPFVHYYETGDFVEAYWKNESFYADPITIPEKGDIMALMRSFDTKEIVGIQIFGAKQLLEKKEEK